MHKGTGRVLFRTEILDRVGPEDIAHESARWGFSESVDLDH